LKAAIVTTHWNREGTEPHNAQKIRHQEFSDTIWKEWAQSERGLYKTNNTAAATERILRSVLQKDVRVGLNDAVIV
jgi:hypothetical protein